MKKLFISIILILSMSISPIMASNVSYSGNSGDFVFTPGSDYSMTDLFTNFKDVMPGDKLTQQITVKNSADKKVKVNIYMRSLGAHEDSKDFLSQMNLKVSKSTANDMAYMFDASADQKAGLEDWVLLGTLYSGGIVNLDVTLEVPVEMDSTYMARAGYLEWEFKVEEMPVDKDDPKPPSTGDNSNTVMYAGLLAASSVIILVLLKKKKDKSEE